MTVRKQKQHKDGIWQNLSAFTIAVL